ncbi:MAG: DUF1553 domain-containing protein [Planctomycetes bacterium]|nr:DUF1553 domain-containing protein [Planctomycetota bacterium]
MKRWTFAVLAVLLPLGTMGAQPRAGNPFEGPAAGVATHPIDSPVRAACRRRGIEPAPPCSDQVFVRRVFLDVIGTLPDPAEVTAFLADRRSSKREALIDALLERPEYADYQSLKWCDILRVKAEFPINLWPNAVQAYHRWIRDFLRENRPLDRVARDLLTRSGSNFREPPVNFWRGVQSRDPQGLAQAVALTFMGSRVETWPAEMRNGFAPFFSRVAFKRTLEWKEEIVFANPAATEFLTATFPDGQVARIAPDEDPRAVFADWLLAPGNPWFARNIVNRVWAWLLGRGVIHEPDDIRPDNPPSIPELLGNLEKEFVAARYDLKALFRLILNSATYQQSPVPRDRRPESETLFAHYIVRQLDAEVLIDALCKITGSGETYSSPIPEPFTYIPEEERSIVLSDGSITSSFLELFGRPGRDTGLESERSLKPTEAQRRFLLNSTDVQGRIDRSVNLRRLGLAARSNPREFVRQLYLLVLSREPTTEEIAVVEKYARTPGLSPGQVLSDLVWALVNTKEFLFRH